MAGPAIDNILDMDAAITAYCKEKEMEEPQGLEKRTLLHLQILESLLV